MIDLIWAFLYIFLDFCMTPAFLFLSFGGLGQGLPEALRPFFLVSS